LESEFFCFEDVGSAFGHQAHLSVVIERRGV
jgi:hypothetical protein